MRPSCVALALVGWLSCLPLATAAADGISSDPVDPSNAMEHIRERKAQRDSLLGVSPLKPLHDAADRGKHWIHRKTYLNLGLMINHVFQGMTDSVPDTDRWGTATDLDVVGTWELVNRGKPNKGNLYFKIQGRWEYGTTGPQNLGFVNLASTIGTANTYSAYTPAFLPIRNLYWEQGSKKARWAFRVGKISTDATLATSRHISPVLTFLPNGGTGLFVSGYCDSGLGAVGVVWPTDRIRLLGLVADANGDRQNWGDISAGDFYKALELGLQIAPKTAKAGFSKITFWHSDGTKDGEPINASSGAEGYGVTVKLEHEFTADGKFVGVARWGKTWKKAALYDDQASLHVLLYDPPGPAGLQSDLFGAAVNYAQASAAGARPEFNVELFYRFPFFTGLDTTLSFQQVIHPANTTEVDHASVFSFRLRAVF